MEKSALRTEAIEGLKGLSNDEKQIIEKGLLSNLTQSTLWKEAKTIGITISQGFEWDTKAIIESAIKAGKTVCAPKCFPKMRLLKFYQFSTFDELEVVYYNLLEPKAEEANYIEKNEIDLLIVPGVMFDKKGYRIGFGGGYYDRFLTDFTNTTVSLSSIGQLVESLPIEKFDLPVQYVITDQGIIA